MRGRYGVFDALDYTKERMNGNKKSEPVKTFMAQHQGLILNSINNIINKNILKKRFRKRCIIDRNRRIYI